MEGFTGFTKAVTIAAGQTSSITFNAANGSAINCNTFYFTASDGATSGVLIFIPSGVLSYSNQPTTSVPNGTAASGLFGYHFTTIFALSMGHGKTATAGTITNLGSVSRTVLVTYGIEHVINPIQAGIRPIYL